MRELITDLKSLDENEDFWTRSRDKVLLRLVKKTPVLDVGCGTGVITRELVPKFNAYSIDIDEEACSITKKINPQTYQIDFTNEIELDLPKFGTIIMPDSLEHMREDEKALKNANKLLEQHGELIISVPYANCFWTKNDDARGHERRYSKKTLKEKLQAAGFEVKSSKYWGGLFLLPILMAKIFNFRVPHESVSRSKINSMLYSYMILENKIPLPIGSALICKAIKVRNI